MKKLIACNFSGGRTSAFMAKFIKESPIYKDYDKIFIFANTGKEKEATLKFIDKCDKEWDLNVVWIETKINPKKGIGVSFKVVDFETAARQGEPFEEMFLGTKGLPNVFGSVCTRDLKRRPIDKFIKSLHYDVVINAIGIRFDERHRQSINAKKENIIYPLIDELKVNSEFIRNWWERQSFDLELKDYEGNCDLCFKKSLRKRLTLIKEDPTIQNWWIEMEHKFATEATPRFDLRSNLSIKEISKKAERPFLKARDKHELAQEQTNLFDNNMDYETDCFCKST